MSTTEPADQTEPGTEVEIVQTSGELERHVEFSQGQVELLKRTIAAGTSDDEFELFLAVCRRTGLDPFARQIFAVMRKDQNKSKMVIQISIDGFRLIAARTGRYTGQLGPWWCGTDGQWKDVWLSTEPPAAARVAVMRAGFVQPLYGVATMEEYRQEKSGGGPNAMWRRMPAIMLAKCAESQALRKAFPAELSGLYTEEEMAQAGGTSAAVTTSTLGFWNDLVAEIKGDEVLAEEIDIDAIVASMMEKESEHAGVTIENFALLPEWRVAAAWHKLKGQVNEIRATLAEINGGTSDQVVDAQVVVDGEIVDHPPDPPVEGDGSAEDVDAVPAEPVEPDPQRPFTED